jgi:hypothetical protein
MQCYEFEDDYGRQFLTTEEKVTKLQKYKEWLENEAKGVDEAITRIKKAK